MDFNLPEELQILKDTVRRFVDKELIPLEREYRPEGEDMPEHLLEPLQQKVKALGLWMLDVPQEYGGAGLDLLSRCVIQEEIARTVALPFRSNPLFGPDVRPVLFHCNEEQKQRFLYPVIQGKLSVCFAQTNRTRVAIPRPCGPRPYAMERITYSMERSDSSRALGEQIMPK